MKNYGNENFSEYEVSDYDLKILIFESTVEYLANTPNSYVKDLASKLNPSLTADLFIKELLVFVPELKYFGIEDAGLPPSNQLKLAAVNVSFLLNNQKLEQIMQDTCRIAFSSSLLSVKYGIATVFIEKVLNEKADGNSK